MKKFALLFFVFHFSFFIIHLSVAQVIQIPADYPTIQQGIDSANPGDTVLVAPGTYFENINFNGKNITLSSLFMMTQDTAYISQTIIDGNQTGSVVTFTTNEDSTALLSGFSIMNGNYIHGGGIYCHGASPRIENVHITNNQAISAGGGIYVFESNPVLKNIIIENNLSEVGAGIYIAYSDPVLRNIIISNNTSNYSGGGIYCYGTPVMKNVTICYNFAIIGGGIYLDASTPLFDDENLCNIFMNEALEGDDLYSSASVEIVVDTFTIINPNSYLAFPISNFTFDILHGKVLQAEADLYVSPDGNNLNSGLTPMDPVRNIGFAMAIIRADSLQPHAIHLLEGFYSRSNNHELFPITLPNYISLAGEDKSAVVLDAEGTANVIHIDSNNSSRISGITITGGSGGYGGGIYCNNSSPTLENLLVTVNTAQVGWYWGGKGGGVFIQNSSPVLKNIVIQGNSSRGSGVNNSWDAGQGGGIYFDASTGVLENVVISDNKSDQGCGIACINSSIYMKNTTISGNRYFEEIYNDFFPPIYVYAKGGGIYCDASASVIFDSISRCNIYNNAAWFGNDIYSDAMMQVVVDTFSVRNPYWYHVEPFENFTFDIRQGYHEQAVADLYVSPDGNDKNSGLSPEDPVRTIHYAYSIILADIQSPQTVYLLEGTYSPSTNGEQFPVRVFDNISLAGVSDTGVILDAEEMTRVMEISSNSTSHISSMTLTRGLVFGSDGAGIHCENSSPVIEDVIIKNNSAYRWYSGSAGNYGGYGGGLYLANSLPVINNIKISGNLATCFGGGIFCSSSEITLKQAELADNLAYSSFETSYAGKGGGIYCSGSDLNLQQVTMIHNVASLFGGGIYYSDTSNINLKNTIMWDDSLTELVNGNPQDGINVLTVSYCNIEGGQDSIQSDPGTVQWLEGNISLDPLFVWAGPYPYMLTANSPCCNTGSPDTTGLYLPFTDLAGGPRVWEDRIDIGAYEWSNVGTDEPAVGSSQFAVSCYPNPSGGIVDFRFSMVDGRWGMLKIYNAQGQEVAVVLDEKLSAGDHSVRWDASELPAGIYYYQLSAKGLGQVGSGKVVKY